MPTLKPKLKRSSPKTKTVKKKKTPTKTKRAVSKVREAISEDHLEQLQLLESLDLPDTDGVPLESSWHRACINLLIESVKAHFHRRSDYCVGGNMCLYYSIEQVKNQDFLGPDFFFVHGESQTANRDRWAVWEQGGRYPDVIIELLSRKTAKRDRTEKKEIYRGVFHTSEYFLYDPIKKTLEGFRLVQNKYAPIEVDSHGRMWSEELELWVGKWDGHYQDEEDVWLRFFDHKGHVVQLSAERERVRAEQEKSRAEQEKTRAEQEKTRAEQAELRASQAEEDNARLKALLAKKQS